MRQIARFRSVIILLSFILLGLVESSCCPLAESQPRAIPATVEEAREDASFALYLPTYLPPGVDDAPQVYLIRQDDSLSPYVEIYYTREEYGVERMFLIIASRAGSSSRINYATNAEQLIPLSDGSLAVNQSDFINNTWFQENELITGPPYQTCLWWDLGIDQEKAWYTIYSTLSLTETLAIVNSMQLVSH